VELEELEGLELGNDGKSNSQGDGKTKTTLSTDKD
jgi:hypothetical protein